MDDLERRMAQLRTTVETAQQEKRARMLREKQRVRELDPDSADFLNAVVAAFGPVKRIRFTYAGTVEFDTIRYR